MVDSPAPIAVQAAIQQLVDIGALAPVGTSDFDLTSLGHYLALFPVDVSAGKMLVFGAVLRYASIKISRCAAHLDSLCMF